MRERERMRTKLEAGFLSLFFAAAADAGILKITGRARACASPGKVILLLLFAEHCVRAHSRGLMKT